MWVCRVRCDYTRILIGYVLSDANVDWLVGNMSAYRENFDQEVKKQHFSSFIESFSRSSLKAIKDFFRVYIASSKHSRS